MELHVLLAGIEFGPYSDDKARQLLGEGFLSASDPAKRTDETNWLTLSQLLGDFTGIEPSPTTAAPAPTFVPPPGSFGDPVEEESAPAAIDEPEPAAAEWEAPEPEPEEAIPLSTTVSEATDEPPAPEPFASIPEARPPQEPLAEQPPPSSFSASSVAGGLSAPPPAAPRLQVSVPQRGKKGAVATRTGSLLAMEALHAARDRSGILPPTRPVLATTTAPVPEFEPEPAPPRKRTPVKLGGQPPEEPAPAPQRKAIKLTGPIGIGLIGIAPQLDRISEAERPSFSSSRPSQPAATPGPRPGFPRATTAPRLPAAELAKFSGFIARPSDAARSRTESQPESQSSPILLRERRDTGALKPPRKTIKLTGPVTLPGGATGFTTPLARAPQTDPDEGPMLRERTTRPVPSVSSPESGPGRTAPIAPPRVEPLSTTKSFALPSAAPFFEHATERPEESAATGSGEAYDAPSGDALTASGSLLSRGEMTEKRSLKITGSLKHPSSVPPPVQLSSASSDSGPLAAALQERSSFTPPVSLESLEASDKFSSVPVAEDGVFIRPPSGKIPVSEMPAEGVKVLARRLTSKVPLPASPAESLASESPARPLPPPLPREKIELPAAAAFGAAAVEEAEISRPLSREEFEASPAAASFAALAPAEIREDPSSTLPPLETIPSPGPGFDESSGAADAEQVSAVRPEKVRLRRPVKLELNSRKVADSGRITLETFSKLAKPGAAEPTVPVAADPIAAAQVPAPTPAPDKTLLPAPEPAASPQALKSNSSLDFPKRLEEAPFVTRPPREKKKYPLLGLILYTIIGVGIVAAFVVAFLIWHRSATDVSQIGVGPQTPATNNLAPPESAPPPSASPPGNATSPGYTTAVLTPGASASAPTAVPAVTPEPAAVVSTNAPAALPPAPTPATPATAPDLQRQSSAFVSDGILKYQHGDLDGAIAAYGQALDLDPKSSTAYFNRGIAKAAHDDLDGAIADYTQALEIDPTMAGAYYYRGLARHSKAELDGALSDYDQAVQMDPRNALAFFNRGLIRMQKDDVDGAIVDSSRAVQLDPHLIQSYYDRGLGRMAKGAMDAALTDMQAFTEQAPQDAYTDYARLYIWLIQTRGGQLAEANQELSKAMNGGWNGTPDAMVTRIGEYLLGQISEEELIKASASAIPIKDQGQRCEAWYFVGMRQLVEGDKDSAIDSLRKCVDTQKTDYCEYILAEEQLRNLSAAGTTAGATTAPPPPPRALPVTLPDPGTIAPATAP